MSRSLLAVLSLVMPLSAIAPGGAAHAEEGPATTWVSQLGGAGADVIRGVAPGPAGSWFIAGSFEEQSRIGTTPIGPSAGRTDAVLARVAADGSVVWARHFGSAASDFIYDADAHGGQPVVTGLFTNTVDFGGVIATSVGSGDTFTAKYDADGKLLWVRRAGGPGLDGGNEVAVAASGRVYVIGNTYGDFVVEGTTLPWRGSGGPTTQDAFIVVYESDGRFAWARSIGGSGDDMGRAISVDGAGNVLVAGSFTNTAQLEASSLTSAGKRDVWVAKYGPDGGLLWQRRFGSAGEDYARGIDPDAEGNVYVSGVFSGTVDFGGFVLSSAGASADVFVAKLDSSGKTLWARAIGGTGADEGCEIEVDANGVICAGEFAGTATIAGKSLTSLGKRDLFMLRLDHAGQDQWVQQAGGAEDDVNYCLALDRSSGASVSAGTFFGTSTLGSHSITSAGDADAYLWAMNAKGSPGAPNNDGGGGTSTPDGGAGFGGAAGSPGTAADAGVHEDGGGSLTDKPSSRGCTMAARSQRGGPVWIWAALLFLSAMQLCKKIGRAALVMLVAGVMALSSSACSNSGDSEDDAQVAQDAAEPEMNDAGSDTTVPADTKPDAHAADAAGGSDASDAGGSADVGVGDPQCGTASQPGGCSDDPAVRCQDVNVPEIGSSKSLVGRIYAPPPGAGCGPWPAVALLPGGGSNEARPATKMVGWAATRLARARYIVIVATPSSPGPGNVSPAYMGAAKSQVTFLLSQANPYRAEMNATAIGAAGWSLGARSLTQVQADDERIGAIVGWDNLATSEYGDEGSPNCMGATGVDPTPNRFRVPALGIASDGCDGAASDSKQTAAKAWKAAGQPAMQIVLAGSNHLDFGSAGDDAIHDAIGYYTIAWFDRWLRGNTSARERLIARTSISGRDLTQLLSSKFSSGAYFDGLECPNMRAGCP